jgi:hypothetical protein
MGWVIRGHGKVMVGAYRLLDPQGKILDHSWNVITVIFSSKPMCKSEGFVNYK